MTYSLESRPGQLGLVPVPTLVDQLSIRPLNKEAALGLVEACLNFYHERLGASLDYFTFKPGRFKGWDDVERTQELVSRAIKFASGKFGASQEELNQIFTRFHEQTLKRVDLSLTAFYLLGDSEASRFLDATVWFAKKIEVPRLDYVRAVLNATPVSNFERELRDQAKENHLTRKQISQLRSEFNPILPSLPPDRKT